MSNAEVESEPAGRAAVDDGIALQLSELTVVDTTELRWFVEGLLPDELLAWFTGSTGVAGQRWDTYLLDGRLEVGVKRRSQHTLERKVRRLVGDVIELGPGLAGRLEVWRKWTPADGFVEEWPAGQWVDVHKSVVKRRFALDGTELAFSADEPTSGPGCDVEVASVRLGDLAWWTFAFAAFGPFSTRRTALVASWQALGAGGPCPEPFGPRTGRAMGYPEWLERTAPEGSLRP